MAVFQLPTDGIADGAITTAKINASVSLGASVNVILDGTDGGGSNAGDNLILDGTDGAGANAGDKVQHDDVQMQMPFPNLLDNKHSSEQTLNF